MDIVKEKITDISERIKPPIEKLPYFDKTSYRYDWFELAKSIFIPWDDFRGRMEFFKFRNPKNVEIDAAMSQPRRGIRGLNFW